MFAGDTLYELRVSLQLAELERTGVRKIIGILFNKKKTLFSLIKGHFTTYFTNDNSNRHLWSIE